MKIARFLLVFGSLLLTTARADLSIVQKVEGGGPVTDMTIKIKGAKARIDASPKVTSILDSQTGEMITLMHEQKSAVRVSAEKMRAATEMVSKFTDKDSATPSGKLVPVPTGKKETINGNETELYTYETSSFKATYWIAKNYPDSANILKQMETLKSALWQKDAKAPDYHDFPGVPLKTEILAHDHKVTSTIVSIKEDPLSDADFAVPADYKEVKTPDLGDLLGGKGNKPASENSPGRP